MSASVAWEGLSEFRQALKGLSDDIKAETADIVGETLQNCAYAVESQYPEFETGNLKKGVKIERDSPLSGRVRSTAPHAHLYELGTVQRSTKKSGANRGRMRPHPVIIPTAIRYRARMQEKCEALLRVPRPDVGSGTLA